MAPSFEADLRRVSIAFTIYHHLLRSRPSAVAEALDSGDFSMTRRIGSAIALSCARELRIIA